MRKKRKKLDFKNNLGKFGAENVLLLSRLNIINYDKQISIGL
jgi:hypothetical protein